MIKTEPVSFEVELGSGSASHHLGLIVLNTDETVEYDMHRMLPEDSDAMFFTSRVATVNPVTIENLRKMGPQLGHAASLILPDLPLRAIAYSCTSGTLALGYEEVAAQIKSGLNKDIRDSVAVVTPLTAALDAIKTLRLKRIAMLTPYIDSVNQPMKDFFEQHGIRIVKLKSLMVESDVDIAQVPPAAIKQGAEETYIEEADGLFISCTALRSTETLGELEASLQRTVLSSNQCMFWSMMKAAGYKKSITGYGQLLENFL